MPIGEGYCSHKPGTTSYEKCTPLGAAAGLLLAGGIFTGMLYLDDRARAALKSGAAEANSKASVAELTIRSNVLQLRDFNFSAASITPEERKELKQIADSLTRDLEQIEWASKNAAEKGTLHWMR